MQYENTLTKIKNACLWIIVGLPVSLFVPQIMISFENHFDSLRPATSGRFLEATDGGARHVVRNAAGCSDATGLPLDECQKLVDFALSLARPPTYRSAGDCVLQHGNTCHDVTITDQDIGLGVGINGRVNLTVDDKPVQAFQPAVVAIGIMPPFQAPMKFKVFGEVITIDRGRDYFKVVPLYATPDPNFVQFGDGDRVPNNYTKQSVHRKPAPISPAPGL